MHHSKPFGDGCMISCGIEWLDLKSFYGSFSMNLYAIYFLIINGDAWTMAMQLKVVMENLLAI